MRLISSLIRNGLRLKSNLAYPIRYYSSFSNGSNSRLIIFDKDGTLICFHTLWTPWVTSLAQGLERSTGCLAGFHVASDVYRLLGVCTYTKAVGPGLLAEGTMPEIKSKLIQLLSVYGFTTNSAIEIMEQVWRDNESLLHPESFTIKPIINNLRDLFKILKMGNFKIAVCTADNRRSTELMLKFLNLNEFVDATICGDDIDSKPKPNPYNAMKLCGELGIPSRYTCVVGDTVSDLRMGKEAGLLARIGVLSGIGTKELLSPYASHIADNIGSIIPILIGDQSIFGITSKTNNDVGYDKDQESSFDYPMNHVLHV